jgi:hypothetical protein
MAWARRLDTIAIDGTRECSITRLRQEIRASPNEGDQSRALGAGQRHKQKAAAAIDIAPALHVIGELRKDVRIRKAARIEVGQDDVIELQMHGGKPHPRRTGIVGGL